jgi:hypothetical protein
MLAAFGGLSNPLPLWEGWLKIKKDSKPYELRYVIVDDDGKTVDDAQGYGYKSKAKATKAMWYKFKGGKGKISQQKGEKRKYFKEHPGLDKFIERMYECYFKEIARDEITEQDLLDEIKEEFGIDMPKKYLKLD